MLICCKLYISESRNTAALDLIEPMASLDRKTIIVNKFKDSAYNRIGYTLVSCIARDSSGEPEYISLRQIVLAMVEAAYQTINLEMHLGAHPRLGVVDHIVFHPLSQASLEEVAWLAKLVAADIANKLQVPIFLYEAAHQTGKALDAVRRELNYFQPNYKGNQWFGWPLPEVLPVKPDIGPSMVSQARGITIIGASRWVATYNVPVMSSDLLLMRKIARIVSARGGGLQSVQAIGLFHGEDSTEIVCILLEPNHIGADQVQNQIEIIAAQEELEVEKGYFTDFSPEMTLEKYWKLTSLD
ncbi:hypothetical protein Syun_008289 [Stephania yunnanensis]|uniref:Formiminotransferase N-terminal subdomain domain-containing protein n=1 Tax=Stephania yunnanensis TaxID=152371 RepID=A0AAP0PPV6_9MAGN